MRTEMITNETIFSTEWAKDDRRSVKACLTGRADSRILWWELNCAIHRLLRPKASLEEVMLSYHSRHHAITLNSMTFLRVIGIIADVIISHGPIAGARQAIALAKKESFPAETPNASRA